MLRRLHIENLAVVESATLDFHNGLNVITGSTGAGKSLIVGAVNLLLGEKGNAELIRSGADEALVSATFTVPSTGAIEITRRISRAGRSSVTINDHTTT